MANISIWKRLISGLCGIGILFVVLFLARQRGVSGKGMQEYEEALGGAMLACGGILALWWPQAVRWPANPSRKRVFAVFAIAVGTAMALQHLHWGPVDPWAP